MMEAISEFLKLDGISSNYTIVLSITLSAFITVPIMSAYKGLELY